MAIHDNAERPPRGGGDPYNRGNSRENQAKSSKQTPRGRVGLKDGIGVARPPNGTVQPVTREDGDPRWREPTPRDRVDVRDGIDISSRPRNKCLGWEHDPQNVSHLSSSSNNKSISRALPKSPRRPGLY